MLFAGIDPGSVTWALAAVDEVGRPRFYREYPSQYIKKSPSVILNDLLKLRPNLIALPSGHGLPFVRGCMLTDKEIFLMTLTDEEGPLTRFLRVATRLCESFTIPSVVELQSVPEFRKRGFIDLGTADKVASAFLIRSVYDSFIHVEMGRKFSSIIVVKSGEVVEGIGGSVLPGLGSRGCIDSELAYIMSKKGVSRKEDFYGNVSEALAIERLNRYVNILTAEYDVPVVVTGPAWEKLGLGIHIEFKMKEAALGAAHIANALGGGVRRVHIDMLRSSGDPLSYVPGHLV